MTIQRKIILRWLKVDKYTVIVTVKSFLWSIEMITNMTERSPSDFSPFDSKMHALLYMMLHSPRPIVSIEIHDSTTCISRAHSNDSIWALAVIVLWIYVQAFNKNWGQWKETKHTQILTWLYSRIVYMRLACPKWMQ